MARLLALTMGLRWSDYRNHGNIWTWRTGLDWEPAPGLRIRGDVERSARAPSFAESVIPITGNVASLALIDPCSLSSPGTRAVPAISALCQAQMSPAAFANYVQTSPAVSAPLIGNGNLTPEKADNIRIGAAWAPEYTAPGLGRVSLSASYYAIHIRDAIGLFPLAQYSLAACFNLDPERSNPSYDPSSSYCRLIKRNAAGIIDTISQPYVNSSSIKTSGIDLGAIWQYELPDGASSFEISANITRVLDFKVKNSPTSATQNFEGTLGDGLLYSPSTSGSIAPQPRWRALTRAHYRTERFGFQISLRYMSGMKDLNAIPGYSPSGTPSYSLFDTHLQAQASDNVTLRLGIDNVFDKMPPSITYPGMTMASIYDTLGRSVQISARVALN
jgi:iron complex outermembrane receptor protein